MVEPEIYEFLDWITELADSLGLVVLPEVHDEYATHERLAGARLLDLRLRAARPRPPRLPDRRVAAARRRISPDRRRASSRPSTATTASPSGPISTASCARTRCSTWQTHVRRQGGNVNRILSDAHAAGVDVHQLNCTYYSALDVRRRAVPGGPRDPAVRPRRAADLLRRACSRARTTSRRCERTGEGRAINRHDYTARRDPRGARAAGRPAPARPDPAAEHAPGVRRRAVGRRRWTDPERGRRAAGLRWQHGEASVALEVDLAAGRATVVDESRAAREVATSAIPQRVSGSRA